MYLPLTLTLIRIVLMFLSHARDRDFVKTTIRKLAPPIVTMLSGPKPTPTPKPMPEPKPKPKPIRQLEPPLSTYFQVCVLGGRAVKGRVVVGGCARFQDRACGRAQGREG